MSWIASSFGSVQWLSFTTANSGIALAPATIASVTVRASAAGMSKGNYSTTLVLGVADEEELLVPLVFVVSSPLEVTPGAVSEMCLSGSTTATSVIVTNHASTAVTWTAVRSASWISPSPTSGSVPLAPSASVTVSLTLGAGLAAATTNIGSLALADDGVASEVAVTVGLESRSVTGQRTLYVGSSTGLVKWDGAVVTSIYGSAVHSNLILDAESGLLYAGGGKLDIASNTYNNASLGSGMSGGVVYALALHSASGSMHVGGSFTSAGGVSSTALLAKFDIASSTWSA